jgi:hypothetical protein
MIALLLFATILKGPADVETLTAASDAVAHARVVRSESRWAPSGGVIYTAVTLQLIESWKGAPEPEFQVVVEGGAAGDYDQVVQGAAQFSASEEVVVFLHRRTSGIYSVSKMALGKFSVSAHRAQRDRHGLICVDCLASERDDLSFDELRARVLAKVAR